MYEQLEDEKQLAALRKTVMQYAQDCGMVGGMTIMHPYRGRKKYMDAIRSGRITGKKSYHFHIVGARISTWEKSNDFYERTGWVYKWVDETIQNGPRQGEKRNMYEKIRYELDHAGLPELNGKYGQISTWWGIFSRNAIAQVKTITHEPRLCPVCRLQAHRFELDESIDKGPAEATITRLYHSLRDESIKRARQRFKLSQGPTRYETLEGVKKRNHDAVFAEGP